MQRCAPIILKIACSGRLRAILTRNDGMDEASAGQLVDLLKATHVRGMCEPSTHGTATDGCLLLQDTDGDGRLSVAEVTKALEATL